MATTCYYSSVHLKGRGLIFIPILAADGKTCCAVFWLTTNTTWGNGVFPHNHRLPWPPGYRTVSKASATAPTSLLTRPTPRPTRPLTSMLYWGHAISEVQAESYFTPHQGQFPSLTLPMLRDTCPKTTKFTAHKYNPNGGPLPSVSRHSACYSCSSPIQGMKLRSYSPSFFGACMAAVRF